MPASCSVSLLKHMESLCSSVGDSSDVLLIYTGAICRADEVCALENVTFHTSLGMCNMIYE